MKPSVHLPMPILVSTVLLACTNAVRSVELSKPTALTADSDVAAKSTPTLVVSSTLVSSATDVPSVDTAARYETFALAGEQAQEVAAFMNFIRAYDNGRLEEALAWLTVGVDISDCDYQEVGVIQFRGKSQVAEWLRERLSEHDQLIVSHVYNENPDPVSGGHVIGVEYSRRTSTTLEQLGFGEGIKPKGGSKVVFEAESALIQAFANGPAGGDPNFCRPGK